MTSMTRRLTNRQAAVLAAAERRGRTTVDALGADFRDAALKKSTPTPPLRMICSPGTRRREPDLAAVVVEADDAGGVADESLDGLAWASARPVGLVGEETVNGVNVDPAGVVVELEAVWQRSFHRGSVCLARLDRDGRVAI